MNERMDEVYSYVAGREIMVRASSEIALVV